MYFIHMRFPDRVVVDPEGSDYEALADAEEEARQAIRDLTADYLRGGRKFEVWSIRVCDRHGDLLSEVFTADTLAEVIPPIAIDVPSRKSTASLLIPVPPLREGGLFQHALDLISGVMERY